jgi:hypothetical protein
MERAYNAGREKMTDADLPQVFADDLFEPTLNSTNPVKNYPDLYNCLKESNGIITDVEPELVHEKSSLILDALKKRGFTARTDKENSILIEFAGLLKLAEQNQFNEDDVIVMLACGRGKDTSTTLLEPDAVISAKDTDPVALKNQLDAILVS